MHFQRITNKFTAFLVALGLLLLNNGGFRHVIAQRRNLSAERVGKQAAQIKYYISRKGKEGREGGEMESFPRVLPLSGLEEMLSSSFGFATCVIMDVLSMETRCCTPTATPLLVVVVWVVFFFLSY